MGGFLAMGFASDNQKLKKVPLQLIKDRFKNIEGELHYYNPQIHLASFCLPTFMQKALIKNNSAEKLLY